jgi:hypothetical protein
VKNIVIAIVVVVSLAVCAPQVAQAQCGGAAANVAPVRNYLRAGGWYPGKAFVEGRLWYPGKLLLRRASGGC